MKPCAIPIFLWASIAHAQTTLAPVSPPTDWTGVAIVSVLGLIFVAIAAAYIAHIKRTPGVQVGEAELEKIWKAIESYGYRRVETPPIPPQAPPLTFDGITFANEAELQQYKSAKSIVDTYRKEPQ